MTDSVTPVRPSSAPPIGSEPVVEQEEIVRRCSVCFKKVFEKPFAEVSSPNNAFEKRKSICGYECFQKYIGVNKKKRLVRYLPIHEDNSVVDLSGFKNLGKK